MADPLNAMLPPNAPVDLTNCDREPIHIPGSVQSHAVMLVIQEPGLTVRQASANAPDRLGLPMTEILGASLASLLPSAAFDHLRKNVLVKSLEASPNYLPAMRAGRSVVEFEAQVHRFKGALILELEDWPDRPKVLEAEIFSSLREMLGQLKGDQTVTQFCQHAADHVRAFIGFDRVMVYRFDPDLSGHVIAEAKRENLESYLGWHYPASDIPKQARELFRLSKLRLLPDLRYAPVPLQPALKAGEAPLDMSFCVTRSVSPIHVEYLQNMGVDASMSISVVIDGQLWGLFACHHDSPRYVPHALRMACDFLAHTLSFLVAGREAAEDHDYTLRLHERRQRLEAVVAEEMDFVSAVRAEGGRTLVGVDATGAAMVAGDEVAVLGEAPPAEAIKALAAYFAAELRAEVWSTDRLVETMPAAAAWLPGVGGLMAVCLSRESRSYAFWFRREVPQTINWAGDPNKPVTPGPLGDRLTPRKSFALWRQEVRGRSTPWQKIEVEAAQALRHSYHEIYARRAADLARLNAELAERNEQLDAFAYIASHDLKEPLRGIRNFSQFVLEDSAAQLDQEGVANLQTVTRLTKRMESLLDSLLKYSRLSRAEISRQPTDMNVALSDALDLLTGLRMNRAAEIRIPRPLPPAQADTNLVTEILANLVSNALKYNDKPERWVEIGFVDPEPGQPVTYYVADNGIGIAAEHHAHIFRIFKRLHERDEFGGGTGVGLTIARKLVERHGGEIDLRSEPGQGSRFQFTLQPKPVP
jgi:light-regulated signal transduction histidine kinase (bacteriophytochrome)